MEKEIESSAAKCAGNWRKFESFAWHRGGGLDDANDWYIVYTTNRGAGIATQSNHAAMSKAMAPFMQGDDPDCVEHSASHWAVGWCEGFEIRVYGKDRQITDAFKEWHEMCIALENYPILDESDFSERELLAAEESIEQTGANMVIENAPEGWVQRVSNWLWENDQSELENTDGHGASPSEDSVRSALEALGLLAVESED